MYISTPYQGAWYHFTIYRVFYLLCRHLWKWETFKEMTTCLIVWRPSPRTWSWIAPNLTNGKMSGSRHVQNLAWVVYKKLKSFAWMWKTTPFLPCIVTWSRGRRSLWGRVMIILALRGNQFDEEALFAVLSFLLYACIRNTGAPPELQKYMYIKH